MIVLFTGLPGAGKSHLAGALARAIGADVLNRDAIRNAIFPRRDLDYSPEQNELASQILYRVAEYILQRNRERVLILDGRPFSRQAQLTDVVRLAAKVEHELRVIHCTAPDAVVRERLMADLARSKRMAADRPVAKYLRSKQVFEPLVIPHLTIDTTRPVEQCVREVMQYLDRALPASGGE
jgi:predicted kinase